MFIKVLEELYHVLRQETDGCWVIRFENPQRPQFLSAAQWSDTIKPYTQSGIINFRKGVHEMGRKYTEGYKADVLKLAEEIGV